MHMHTRAGHPLLLHTRGHSCHEADRQRAWLMWLHGSGLMLHQSSLFLCYRNIYPRRTRILCISHEQRFLNFYGLFLCYFRNYLLSLFCLEIQCKFYLHSVARIFCSLTTLTTIKWKIQFWKVRSYCVICIQNWIKNMSSIIWYLICWNELSNIDDRVVINI